LRVWMVLLMCPWWWIGLHCRLQAVVNLGRGDMGSRPGRQLAGGGTGRPHKKIQNGDICVIGFLSLICTSRQWYHVTMWDCGSINLDRVGTLILACELDRLLPGKVSHSELQDGKGAGVGWPQVSPL
jgi:hypothetical protein